MTEYECPDCHRQMAVIFLGDGTAYDECECGTQSMLYDTETGMDPTDYSSVKYYATDQEGR